MSIQKLQDYIRSHWQSLTAYGALFGILGIALVWNLNSLVPGYSDNEATTYNHGLSLQNIFDNPLNAPYLITVRALMVIHPDSYVITRLVSVVAGAIVLVIFAALLRHWHSTRTAIFGTLLFGLSAWFMHTARMGTPDVLMFGVFVLAAAGFWLKQTNSWLALLACFIGATLLLYVPGMIWFVIFGLVWQWRAIDRVLKKHLAVVSGGALLMLAALAPLGLALYKHHELIKPYLGLPAGFPSPLDMLRNLLEAPFHLLVRNSSADPATWLGNAPILDVFTLVMLGLGIFLYFKQWRLARTPIFLFVFLVSLGLMTIGSTAITYTVIMPFVYIMAAGGLTYLLGEWFRVFPKNPIARGIGWGLMGLVVGLACLFQMTHYFVGWPQARATHKVYTNQQP